MYVACTHARTHAYIYYMYGPNKFTWKIIQINRDNDNGSEEHWSIKATTRLRTQYHCQSQIENGERKRYCDVYKIGIMFSEIYCIHLFISNIFGCTHTRGGARGRLWNRDTGEKKLKEMKERKEEKKATYNGRRRGRMWAMEWGESPGMWSGMEKVKDRKWIVFTECTISIALHTSITPSVCAIQSQKVRIGIKPTRTEHKPKKQQKQQQQIVPNRNCTYTDWMIPSLYMYLYTHMKHISCM